MEKQNSSQEVESSPAEKSESSEAPSRTYDYESYLREANKDKIAQLKEQFLEQQIEKPLKEIGFVLDVILNRWAGLEWLSDIEFLPKVKAEITGNFLEFKKTGSRYKEDEYLYDRIHVFLKKNDVEIESLLRKREFEYAEDGEEIEIPLKEDEIVSCLSEEKKLPYLNALLDLTKDCCLLCINKFEEIISSSIEREQQAKRDVKKESETEESDSDEVSEVPNPSMQVLQVENFVRIAQKSTRLPVEHSESDDPEEIVSAAAAGRS